MRQARRLVVLAALVALAACSTPQTTSVRAARSIAFGTLVSPPERSADEARAGVSAAMVELSWEQAEPAEGTFDDRYLRSVRADVDTLRATDRTITLGLGLHHAPEWVLALPGGRFVDENGDSSEEANLVFAQRSRNAAEHYLAHVAAVLDPSLVDDVRLTSGGVAEVLYPGGGHYWAFDDNARGGADLPASMPPNPLPGWRPGQPGPDESQVREWADWYVGALDDVVVWQLSTLTALGFNGGYEVLTPGVGVRPGEYATAIRDGLPAGLLGAGAAWQVFYERLPRRPDLTVYVSSVADGSGGNDVCRAEDQGVPLDSSEVEGWSAVRWQARLAGEYGYALSGENPGWRQSPALDRSYVDVSAGGMMAAALAQARACGFRSFLWAHAEQLWDGTVPFEEYAARIAGA
ncbi:hypothetical protein [Pseudonocardia sp.]|uniref:hypothetical protein n=1 Tax=Pseudonocardia sp. TaxID=60912 RepID=UPI0026226B46|nr:hypothetical protein [Pseudonocardia sp.]